jgi:1,4-dihydroxy-6-naphthoate synthase
MTMIKITAAHSPDPDDAFMYFGIASGKVDTEGIDFELVPADIETLNRAAIDGRYDVSAVSFHAYAHLNGKYLLLPHGSSMAEDRGPVVVARQDGPASTEGITVAVPGTLTTAFLALRLYDPDVEYLVMPFDQIQEKVRDGTVAAGLLIHEGQLTYQDEGLKKIVDLGEWWAERSGGLPLPLGANVIRRDLGPETVARVSRILHASIVYSLNHRAEALEYALQFGRGVDRAKADRFVGMYVNDLTLQYGDRGRAAVQRLMDEAWQHRLIPSAVVAEFSA